MMSERTIAESRKEYIHRKIFYYSLLLVAITLPINLVANSLSIILLTLNWIIAGNIRKKIELAKSNSFLLSLFLFFYILHVIGMLYTSNTHDGRFELEKKLSLFVLPVILATSAPLNTNQFKNILISFFTVILTASLICVGYAIYRTNFFETYKNPDWLYFSYVDLTKIVRLQPTYFALYVCFSTLILLFFIIKNYSRYGLLKRIIFLSGVMYLFFFLFLLASRMAIFALVLIIFSGIIYYYYKIRKIGKGLIILAGISLCLAALTYKLPFMRERFLQAFGIDQKAVWISQYGNGNGVQPEMRSLKWKSAINIIKENWFAGVGTGDGQDALQGQYKNIGFEVGYNSRYNAHNQYLETWLGLGIIGLCSLLACLGIPSILAFRKKNYLYLSFLLLFSICCVTESMLCRQLGIVFYSLFTSLFAFQKPEMNLN